jgi:hypothetical protein
MVLFAEMPQGPIVIYPVETSIEDNKLIRKPAGNCENSKEDKCFYFGPEAHRTLHSLDLIQRRSF